MLIRASPYPKFNLNLVLKSPGFVSCLVTTTRERYGPAVSIYSMQEEEEKKNERRERERARARKRARERERKIERESTEILEVK